MCDVKCIRCDVICIWCDVICIRCDVICIWCDVSSVCDVIGICIWRHQYMWHQYFCDVISICDISDCEMLLVYVWRHQYMWRNRYTNYIRRYLYSGDHIYLEKIWCVYATFQSMGDVIILAVTSSLFVLICRRECREAGWKIHHDLRFRLLSLFR